MELFGLKLPALSARYLFDSRRYLMMSIGAAVVTVLLLVIGIIPQVQTIFELQGKTVSQQGKVEKLEVKVTQLEEILSPEVIAQIEKVDLLLPSKKPLLELLTSLNQVAGQSQVTFTGIELSPGSIASDSTAVAGDRPSRGSVGTGGSADADTLEIELKVQGSLDQLNQFFALVEKTAPVSTIMSLSLSPQSQGGVFSDQAVEIVGDIYEAEVKVATAYFTKPVSAAVDAPLPALSQTQQQFLAEIAQFTVTELAPQQDILGGGLNDLFGVLPPPIGIKN